MSTRTNDMLLRRNQNMNYFLIQNSSLDSGRMFLRVDRFMKNLIEMKKKIEYLHLKWIIIINLVYAGFISIMNQQCCSMFLLQVFFTK